MILFSRYCPLITLASYRVATVFTNRLTVDNSVEECHYTAPSAFDASLSPLFVP
jgi:hypothetical protein